MKILSLLFLTIFLGNGCDAQKKQDIKSAVVEYTANTRGFYQKITIHDHLVSVSKDRSGNDKALETKISDVDWKVLTAAFKRINLAELPNLKAPTEKRFYDGAAIANLKVSYKGKTYMTTGFDHGFPPAAIEKLVNKITSFAKTEQ
jgi:hypothetical protein